jgi:hypothetical protein
MSTEEAAGNREVGGRASRRDWYLSVEDRRDVIERPIADDLDVSGWELRKALRLLHKSNPPLLEWLKSPVLYRHDPVFAAEFGALATEFYSPRRCFAHYLHMAFGNWRDYLRLARPSSTAIPLRRLGGREEVSSAPMHECAPINPHHHGKRRSRGGYGPPDIEREAILRLRHVVRLHGAGTKFRCFANSRPPLDRLRRAPAQRTNRRLRKRNAFERQHTVPRHAANGTTVDSHHGRLISRRLRTYRCGSEEGRTPKPGRGPASRRIL